MILTIASQIHIVGDAFVYVGNKKLVSNKKEKKNQKNIQKKKNICKIALHKTFDTSSKVVSRRLRPVAVKLQSNNENSSFFTSKILIGKLALSSHSIVFFKEQATNAFLKQKLEYLYRKICYFYISNIQLLGSSSSFSVRPPPNLIILI